MHTICVLQQCDEEVTHHHGIGHGVDVLEQPRGHGPVAYAFRVLAGFLLVVPHIPLIEGNVHVVVALESRLRGVDGGAHIFDESIHIHAGGEERRHVARAVLHQLREIVGMC